MAREETNPVRPSGPWRNQNQAAARRRWRHIGRFVLTFTLVLALFAFGVWLVNPFQKSTVHFVTAFASLEPLQSEPVTFSYVDKEAWDLLLKTHRIRGDSAPLHLENEDLTQEIAEVSARSAANDRLIVSVSANGISRTGKPYLLGDRFTPSLEDSTLVAVEQILESIKAAPCDVKLLILDAGRVTADARIGAAINLFPQVVSDAVRRLEDKRLWVLLSHSEGEISEFAGALGQSVFSHFVQQGLSGGADANRDRRIDLSELRDYVVSRTTSYVASASLGRATQTPQLLCGGGDVVRRDATLIVLPGAKHSPSDFKLRTLPWEELFAAAGTVGTTVDSPEGAADTDNSKKPPDATSHAATQLAKLVVEGWLLRDSLAIDNPRRIDAPHRWREFEQTLIGCEQTCRAGDLASIALARGHLTNQLAFWRVPPSLDASIEAAPTEIYLLSDAVLRPEQTRPQNEAGKVQDKFAAMLASIKTGGLPAWMKANWTDELARIFEFRLVPELLDSGITDNALIYEAVSLRQYGNQVARNWFESSGSTCDQLATADALRLNAERVLIDQTTRAWPDEARKSLAAARRAYDQAEENTLASRDARNIYVAAAHSSTDYIRWFSSFHLAETLWSPSFVQLKQYLDQTTSLADELESVDTPWERIDELQRNVRATADSIEAIIRDDVTHIAADRSRSTHDAWLVERVLSTSLPKTADRIKLLKAVQAHYRERSAQPPTGPSASSLAFDGQHRRETALLHLCARRLATSKRNGLRDEIESLISDLESPAAILDVAELNEKLANLETRNLQRIHLLRPKLSGLDPDTTRAAAMETERILLSSDPRDGDSLAYLRLRPTLDKLKVARRLRGQRRRLLAFSQMDGEQSQYLGQIAEQLSRRRRSLFPNAKSSDLQKSLRMETATNLSLTESPEQTLVIQVDSSKPSPMWLVAEYDDSLLKVSSPAGWPLYGSGHVRSASSSPYESLFKLPGTVKLDTSGRLQVPLIVRRGNAILPTARLVLTAVTAADSVRKSIHVDLPGAGSLALSVSGLPGGWSSSSGGIAIHPLPNQDSAFYFSLENRDGAQRTVDVELFRFPDAIDIQLPATSVPIAAATKFVDQLQSGQLAAIKQLVVPAAGTLHLPFPKRSKQASEPTTPPITLDNGMAFVVTDRARDRVSFHRVTVAPQRPRRYVEPIVTYDAGLRLARIQITAIRPNGIPKRGIRVSAELAGVAPEQTVGKLTALITAPKASVGLDVRLPRKHTNTQSLYLHVDGYPRAFIYEITPLQRSGAVSESTDQLAVRFKKPDAILSLDGTQKALAVELAVDAPVGAFSNDRDQLIVGLDVDRDRELSGDPQVMLRSDRQVRTTVTSMLPSGLLVVSTTILDQHAEIPIGTAKNVRANLLSLLTVSGHTAEGHSAENVVLDSLTPIIESTWLPAGNRIAAGSKLELLAIAHDRELSGIATVEAAFDSDFLGEFAPETKLWKAVREEGVGWRVQVPTKGLDLGLHPLLVRATDRAGNFSKYERVSIEIVDKASANIGPFNSVQGSVTFGSLAGAGFKVELIAGENGPALPPTKTDNDGRFTFAKVPVGKYELKATGLLRNMTLLGSKGIEVVAPPAKGVHVRVPVRLPNET